MKILIRSFLLCAMVISSTIIVAAEQLHSVKPARGFVPNETVAIEIAVAVLRPIYGSQTIEGEKPFRAGLHDGIWRVEGSLLPNRVGGVALVEISQSDARIIRVTHSR
jgi:hypothetical protein